MIVYSLTTSVLSVKVNFKTMLYTLPNSFIFIKIKVMPFLFLQKIFPLPSYCSFSPLELCIKVQLVWNQVVAHSCWICSSMCLVQQAFVHFSTLLIVSHKDEWHDFNPRGTWYFTGRAYLRIQISYDRSLTISAKHSTF